MTHNLLIRPRDPMLFRDGRPFNAGQGARTIPWPMPSTVAGFLRTRVARGRTFPDPNLSARLREIQHVGPFLAFQSDEQNWELAFPAPADAGVYDDGGNLKLLPMRPNPSSDRKCTDLPHVDGSPLFLLAPAPIEKPSSKAPPFWTASQTLRWLATVDCKPQPTSEDKLGIRLQNHVRLHTEIQAEQRNVVKHALFRTASLEFDFDRDFHRSPPQPGRRIRPANSRLAFGVFSSIRHEANDWASPLGVGAFGAEQRIAEYAEAPAALCLPPPPDKPLGPLIRLQLITPGVFDDGWVPSWVQKGKCPRFPELKLKLVAAAVRRYVAVSGFDFEKAGYDRIRPTRFLAPAGSTYFFEAEGDARALWLRSICDQDQDCKDGFGLVLVGAWQWHQ